MEPATNKHTVAVLTPDGTPLNPTTPAKARLLKKKGKAKTERVYPVYTIRLSRWSKPKEEMEVQPTALHMDDGETAGMSVVQHNATHERVACGAEIVTTGRDVSDRMADRGRGRRYNKRLGRQKKGQVGHQKLEQDGRPYPVTIELDALQKVRATKLMCRLFPISEIVIETVHVDIRGYLEPTVTGKGYQKPRTIEAKIKWMQPDNCAVCGVELSAEDHADHHVVKRRNGGSNNFTNKIPLCQKCHQSAGDSELCLDADDSRDTRAFGRLQAGRSLLLMKLGELAPVRETRGYHTAEIRQRLGLPKTHINDATATGLDGSLPVTLPEMVWQVQNPTRRSRKLFDENMGVAKYRNAADRQNGVDRERMRLDDHDHVHNKKNRNYRRHVRHNYYQRLKAAGKFNEALLGPGGKEIYSPNVAIHLLKNGKVFVAKRRIFGESANAKVVATFRRNDVVRTAEGWIGKVWSLMSNGTVKILFTEKHNRKHLFTQRIPGKLGIVSRRLCWLPLRLYRES